ncbi:hypothetical protein [Nonomuraea maheshkhaliensis]|uniref:hypothetical protein n=1 Tax=Nonomuraea maheshkhaliensis TaxID=419590 RepID=UPI0031F8D478
MPSNLHAYFDDRDLECLAQTAGELLVDPDHELTTRQRELAERAYKLLVDPDHELTTRTYTYDARYSFTAYVKATGERESRAILQDLADIEIPLTEQGVTLVCGNLEGAPHLVDVNETGK